jgi:hypothetical protein
MQEGAVQLLITIITYFPSSIHRHYDSVSFLFAVARLPTINIGVVQAEYFVNDSIFFPCIFHFTI